MHKDNCFVTFTYDEEHYPQYGSLEYRHFQLFMKRLRRTVFPFRFFMCGEYGEQLGRPHYHALFFGLSFDDAVKCNSVHSHCDVYSSERLNKLWGKGFCTIGEVNYATARYVAAYTLKMHRSMGPDDNFYRRVDGRTGEIVELQPEFAQMSLKPGIGLAWLEKYWSDIYTTGIDGVIVNGTRKKAPRYFDERMRELRPMMMESVDWDREKEALKYVDDQTEARLEVKEKVKLAELKFNEGRKL